MLVVPPEIIHRRIVPSCAGVRPIGCRVFPKIYLQPNKLLPQSIPCVYLGRARNQPGHMCLDPLTKRTYASPHARFIETVFPAGLTQHSPPVPPSIPHMSGTHPSPTAPPSMNNNIIDDSTDKVDVMAPSPPIMETKEAAPARADDEQRTIAPGELRLPNR
eukprot:2700667-Pleurochrysis_carterae.AAC.4